MRLYLKTIVGQFDVTIDAADTAEAQAAVDWLYSLEAQEERAAIQTESSVSNSPRPPEPPEPPETPPEATPEPDPFVVEPATVEQAVDAVKAFAGKHGTVKAREMMATLGIKRTAEITDELVPAVIAACGGA